MKKDLSKNCLMCYEKVRSPPGSDILSGDSGSELGLPAFFANGPTSRHRGRLKWHGVSDRDNPARLLVSSSVALSSLLLSSSFS